MPPTAFGREKRSPCCCPRRWFAAPALAQDESESPSRDPRIDDAGRDISVYPPNPVFDYVHYKLVIDIPDMSQQRFSATATISIRPIATPQNAITLRAGDGLTIKSVTLDGKACTYTHADQRLTISFGAPLPAAPERRDGLAADRVRRRQAGGPRRRAHLVQGLLADPGGGLHVPLPGAARVQPSVVPLPRLPQRGASPARSKSPCPVTTTPSPTGAWCR